jgi:hypothetical protein
MSTHTHELKRASGQARELWSAARTLATRKFRLAWSIVFICAVVASLVSAWIAVTVWFLLPFRLLRRSSSAAADEPATTD